MDTLHELLCAQNVSKRQPEETIPPPRDMTLQELGTELVEFTRSVHYLMSNFQALAALAPELTNKLTRAQQMIEAIEKEQPACACSAQEPALALWGPLPERRKELVENLIFELYRAG